MSKVTADDKIASTSYKQILKPTFIMGGSSLLVTLLGIVRTKIIALVLGPSGVGLIGIYMSIANLVRTVTGMGIVESGMRQIAAAFGTNDNEIIARTVISIRRTALLSGIAGLCVLLLSSSNVSLLTFNTPDHGFDIAILSVTILFAAVAGSQTALVQGTRRIGDLAKLNISGAILGTLISIPIIYIFKESGVVYTLLTVSASSCLTAWWYSRKIGIKALSLSWRDSYSEARPLLKLGLALMLAALMIVGTQYVLRVLIVKSDGLSAAGIYHAATQLSLVYVSVILNAMLTDFYPRLSAAAHDHDHEQCRSLINKQVEVGLLLLVPGILLIMVFAPFVIRLFYSSGFMQAVDILKWQLLGGVLQAASWPMGYMIRAKGHAKLIFGTEFFANGILLSFAWVGLNNFGLPGIGMAYFGKDCLYFLLMYLILHHNYRFVFSVTTLRILGLCVMAAGLLFVTPYVFAPGIHMSVNACIAIAVGVCSMKTLFDKAIKEIIQGLVLRMKARFSF